MRNRKILEFFKHYEEPNSLEEQKKRQGELAALISLTTKEGAPFLQQLPNDEKETAPDEGNVCLAP